MATSDPSRFLPSAVWLGSGLLVLIVGATLWIVLTRQPTETADESPPDRQDPRLSYTGEFQNIHPRVTSVGDDRCAECHPTIAKTFAHHPMGRSLLPVRNQPIGDLIDGKPVSFDALHSKFQVLRVGTDLRYTERRETTTAKPLFEMSGQMLYVMGSGSKGNSFLSEQDGFVTQTPVSWFTQKHIWDVSPGFPSELHVGRPIEAACLFCHTNEVVPVAGTRNRYEQPVFRQGHAIGCERCHGPGSEHVRQRASNPVVEGIDYSIVNPRHLAPDLREAVCQQCHLAGEVRVMRVGRELNDFRPGMPLESVFRILIQDHRGEDRKAVNHAEQLLTSKCYQSSHGALGCATCHDPHEKLSPERQTDRYRSACLKCHDCSTPLATRTANGLANNCATCHMPRFTAGDIVHAASTNHRIVRKAEPARPAQTPGTITRPLVFLPGRAPDLRDSDEARDFAVGLVDLASKGRLPARQVARDALPLLERAIAEIPTDVLAWEAKSRALQADGRLTEALAAAQTVLTLRPGDEQAAVHAARIATELGRFDLARDFWQMAVNRNPRDASYRQEKAILLARSGDWSTASAEAEEVLRLDPARAAARTILAITRCQKGDRAAGEAMFQTVEQLAPPDLREWRKWYAAERDRVPARKGQ